MSIIVITATIDVDPAQRDTMLRAARPLLDAALAERGCRAYTWSVDLHDPGRIHVFEEWDDEDALAAHFAGAPYNDMRQHMRTANLVRSVSAKYQVSAKAPVYNDKGVATVDFAAAGA